MGSGQWGVVWEIFWTFVAGLVAKAKLGREWTSKETSDTTQVTECFPTPTTDSVKTSVLVYALS